MTLLHRKPNIRKNGNFPHIVIKDLSMTIQLYRKAHEFTAKRMNKGWRCGTIFQTNHRGENKGKKGFFSIPGEVTM
jgi:hypothetical protein